MLHAKWANYVVLVARICRLWKNNFHVKQKQQQNCTQKKTAKVNRCVYTFFIMRWLLWVYVIDVDDERVCTFSCTFYISLKCGSQCNTKSIYTHCQSQTEIWLFDVSDRIFGNIVLVVVRSCSATTLICRAVNLDKAIRATPKCGSTREMKKIYIYMVY